MRAGALADDAGGSTEKSGAVMSDKRHGAVLGYSWKNKVTWVSILEIREGYEERGGGSRVEEKCFLRFVILRLRLPGCPVHRVCCR